MYSANSAPITAAINSNRGIVTFLIGATLDLAVSKLQEMVPVWSMARMYAAAPYATADASENMCSSVVPVGVVWIHLGIRILFKEMMFSQYLFQRAANSGGTSSSQSTWAFQNSWIMILPKITTGAISPLGSKIWEMRLIMIRLVNLSGEMASRFGDNFSDS